MEKLLVILSFSLIFVSKYFLLLFAHLLDFEVKFENYQESLNLSNYIEPDWRPIHQSGFGGNPLVTKSSQVHASVFPSLREKQLIQQHHYEELK